MHTRQSYSLPKHPAALFRLHIRLVPPESGKPVSGTRLFLRRLFGVGIGDGNERLDGNFGKGHNLGLFEYLPPDVGGGCEEDGKVAGEKARNVPVAVELYRQSRFRIIGHDWQTYEYVETASDEDQGRAPNGNLSEDGLEGELVR